MILLIIIIIIVIIFLKQSYHSDYKLTKINLQFYKPSVNLSFQRHFFTLKRYMIEKKNYA